VEEPEKGAWGIIGGGLREYNVQQAGDDRFHRICFSLNTPSGEIVGGVLGEIFWGWFHLDLLWVKEELRNQGYGAQLLKRAEDEARGHGAKQAYLDTFTFQAPEFYRKHGYAVFGELPDFPPGHQRCFMTKRLYANA
jgi:GNAT superfamily N-acetyltransferase